MIKNNKKMCAVLLAMVMSVFIVFISDITCDVSASDGKNYEVDWVEFSVEFEENGDVYITEKWNVISADNSFDGILKRIDNKKGILERCDEVCLISCSVNGVRVASAIKHSLTTELPTVDEYLINYASGLSGKTGCYEMKYLLKNVVKIDKSGYAYFRYSFTDDRDISFIGKVNVEFNISPENVIWHYNDCKSQGINEFADVSLPLTCDVKMGPDAFPNARRVDADFEWNDVEGITCDTEPLSMFENIIIAISSLFSFSIYKIVIVFLIIMALIIVLSFRGKIMGKIINKKLGKCEEELKESADRLEKTRIPFIWFLLIPKYKRYWKNHIITFYLEILELYRHRRIILEKDRLIIKNDNFSYIDDPEQRKMDDRFIGLLKSNFLNSNIGTDDVITFDDMCLTLKKESNRGVFMGSLELWGIDYSSTLKSTQLYQRFEREGQLEQIKKDLKLWRKFCSERTRNIRTCVNILQNSTEISYYTVLENVLGYRTLACDVGRGESNLHTFCNLEFVRDSSLAESVLLRFCSPGGEDIPKRKLR